MSKGSKLDGKPANPGEGALENPDIYRYTAKYDIMATDHGLCFFLRGHSI